MTEPKEQVTRKRENLFFVLFVFIIFPAMFFGSGKPMEQPELPVENRQSMRGAGADRSGKP